MEPLICNNIKSTEIGAFLNSVMKADFLQPPELWAVKRLFRLAERILLHQLSLSAVLNCQWKTQYKVVSMCILPAHRILTSMPFLVKMPPN